MTQLTAEKMAFLRHFISPRQMRALQWYMRGEEKQWFISKLAELADLITGMPVTYEQDGKGEDAIVYLHYFAGGQASWYITEKDVEPVQYQAFGLADLFGDGGELGYISIVELIQCDAEIDLHFKPCTLRELKGVRA